MTKYQIQYIASDGTKELDDEVYDSEEEAYEAGEYGCSCHSLGNEILHLSNPGDNPIDEEGLDFEIVETAD